MTFGVELVGDEFYVSYTRGTVKSLTLRLLKPAPDAKLHVYQPLAPGCVRLLRRVPQLDESIVVFEFVTCSVQDAAAARPDYSAVSYCWGTQAAQTSLSLADGSHIPVTAKVATILTRLVADRPLLWLDAVCINQADAAEKARQIPLMASVYRRAGAVEVWLEAGDGLAKVAHLWSEDKLHIVHNPGRADPFTPYRADKMVDVLWSSWFERAWVLQE
ncbi:heterokaryon incompatibility protein-domain-containing protein, partial [Lasiosphaeria ovina]